MKVDSLIEGYGLSTLASLVTLASGEITDNVETLISSRTVNRINLDPMSRVQTATGSDVSFDASQKTSGLGFGNAVFTTTPITNAVFLVVTANVIQKRMIVCPTMTGFVLGDHIKRATNDDRTVFIATQIDQIVTNCKNESHFLNPCIRC